MRFRFWLNRRVVGDYRENKRDYTPSRVRRTFFLGRLSPFGSRRRAAKR